jgi:hypothetical protein
MTMRGGGAAGACEQGSLACAQASQGGLVVRPAKGGRSRLRLGTGGVGFGIGRHVAGALGHIQWNMKHSHIKAISTN